jgi:hypothetical protein
MVQYELPLTGGARPTGDDLRAIHADALEVSAATRMASGAALNHAGARVTRITGCPAAHPWAAHDLSEAPHNTPACPRDVEEDMPCQSGAAAGCEQETAAWLLVVYSPGTHDWARLRACGPCQEVIVRAAVGPDGEPGGVASCEPAG